MFPLLPFVAGLVAGAVAVRVLRNAEPGEPLGKVGERARSGLEKTRETLRGAAVAGLGAVESSSGALKQRLMAGQAESAPEPTEAPVASESTTPAPESEPKPGDAA